MENKNDGEISSGKPLTARQNVSRFAEQVEDYLDSFGIFNNESVDGYLERCAEEWKKTSDVDLACIGAELISHSFKVQEQLNKEQLKVDVCADKIRGLIGHLLHEYKDQVWKDSDRYVYALNDNDAARGYQEYLVRCQALVTRMSNLAYKIDSLSKQLNEISKRRTGTY